jgi:hypothetical protein
MVPCAAHAQADEAGSDGEALPVDDESLIERTHGGDAAADSGVEAIPEKASRASNYQGRIRSEYAEVMAGPGAAYLGRGRVYQNDTVRIVRRNEGGDWLEIDGNGVRGWVRTRYVEITRAAAVAGAGGAVDAGRDRRQTNYAYDKKGRRLRPDGTPVGSGEGAGDSDETPDEASEDDGEVAEPAPEPAASTRAGLGLAPFVGVGVGQVRRVFDSNVEGESTLKHQTAQPKGLALSLGLDWDALKYLRVGARFDGVFLGSTDIPANAALGFDKPVTLDISSWQAGLDALGRYPLGPAWVGGYAGLRLFRQNYQETKQYPLFLTNTLWSAAFGGAAGVDLPVGFVAAARGGYCLPLSLSQDPANAGKMTGGSGFEVGAMAGWRVHPKVAVTAELFFARSKLEFGGESSQSQTFDDASGREPIGYDQARETDTIQGLTLGARGAF